MRTLQLTSPLMTGEDVRAAQLALAGKVNGPFGNYSPGVADGEYGPNSAQAASRARYWLGRSKRTIAAAGGSYTATLDAQLRGKAELTATQRVRRNIRLAMYRRDRESQPLREKALGIAASQVGVTESPAGSNIVLFSRWYSERVGYSFIGPWCAMFVSWAFSRAGSKRVDPAAGRWAYCPYVEGDARAGRNGLSVVSAGDVRPGDLVLFDWSGDGTADHIGIVRSALSGGTFTTVEGNTSPTSQANGGAVMVRSRDLANVRLFCRLND